MKNLVNSIYRSLYGDYNDEMMRNEKPRLIADLIEWDSKGSPMNFYPGKPGAGCYDTAMFVSLTRQPRSAVLKNDQLKPLDEMLHIMFEHIFLKCLGSTETAIFMCDEINTSVFAKYRHQFEALDRLGIHWEVWFVKSSGPEMINKLLF